MIKVAKGILGEEELAEVKEVFEYGYFGLAYKVDQFEKELQKYLNTDRQIVAVNNCTAALHITLDALGVGKGDEVITPSLTFVAAFQAILASGATPVACDIDPDTLLIDLDDVRKRITKNTKAIIPVHYAGNPCDMAGLLKMKEEYGIRIVEDAAHAIGSDYRGEKIGSFGDIACFSFDSIKTITCGEGGAVVCEDPELADLIRQKRLVGMDRRNHTKDWKERSWTFDVKTNGFRYHMSNINAAIGLAQLRKIDAFIARRREICAFYDSELKNLSWIQQLNINYKNVAPFMYVVRVKNGLRDKLKDYLKNLDIETGISYVPNHLHTLFKKEGLVLPGAEKAIGEILSLPLHNGLTSEDLETIVSAIKAMEV